MNQKGLKPIAVIEASKGLLALVVSLGIHQLAGDNIQQIAENLLTHLHLNPASHYPSVLLHIIDNLKDVNLMLVSLGALVYALIRFVEAYGLWHKYRWTEWFALISGGIYLPFEIYELITDTNLLSFSALLINSIIVLYMYAILKSQHSKRAIIKTPN
ncbi:DUF2127 domain-containing protein [Thiomicrorhabdus sp.]|uniref:DUF2127 domain-containing protein n=1 Tax=Thiomicrorhabdus sp. TaxID=2039724 RepID=UPI002AA6B5A4|nr:DUF2127 domain-containing protein [Thiomicrorhabdus sp.]